MSPISACGLSSTGASLRSKRRKGASRAPPSCCRRWSRLPAAPNRYRSGTTAADPVADRAPDDTAGVRGRFRATSGCRVARPDRRAVCRHDLLGRRPPLKSPLRRPSRPEAGDPRGVHRRCLAAVLRAFPAQCPRSTCRKLADDCLQELRWIYDRRELVEVRRDMAARLSRWQAKHPKPCDWVEENIEETLIYYRLPLQNHKHMKSTNMLKRRNGASIEQRNWLLGPCCPATARARYSLTVLRLTPSSRAIARALAPTP